MKNKLHIVQVNTSDIGGGAEKVAFSLHRCYREMGHNSFMLVGYKRSKDPNVIEIKTKNRLWQKVTNKINYIGDRLLGWQYIFYPESYRLLKLLDNKIDIIHFHNLHGGYFDLMALIRLSHIVPTIITLHDFWLLTGHCAHPFNCQRWQTGCGSCPDLDIYPRIFIDGTRFNWDRKQKIFKKSFLYISAPSKWLLNEIRKSYLDLFTQKLIYNGINLEIFKPASIPKVEMREKLNLIKDHPLILFVANQGFSNPWRDISTFTNSFRRMLLQNGGSVKPYLIVLGGDSECNLPEDIRPYIISRGFITDEREMAKYYQSADILIHPTLADISPQVIVEAMACGLPVIASAVGGIPELIKSDENGILIESGDIKKLTVVMEELLKNFFKREKLGRLASETVGKRFNIQDQARLYLEWYEEIIEQRVKYYETGR